MIRSGASRGTVPALAMALVLATTSAVPVAAQGFSAQAQGMFFGFESEDEEKQPWRFCLPTDGSLREAIADQGYADIYLNVPIERLVQARASRGAWVYLLRVDICTGEIVERERLRRR